MLRRKSVAIALCALTLSFGAVGVVSRPMEVKACTVPCRGNTIITYPGYYLSASLDGYDINVEKVQVLIRNLAVATGDFGYAPGSSPTDTSFTDGYFGSNTRAGVIYYQQKHGLKADGIVGPATWQSMMSHPHI